MGSAVPSRSGTRTLHGSMRRSSLPPASIGCGSITTARWYATKNYKEGLGGTVARNE